MHGVYRHEVAGVVGYVSLFTQGIENDNVFLFQINGQRQSLNHCLVMAGLACECAKTIGLQGGVRQLHDGLVRGVVSGFVTDILGMRIGDIALRCCQ